ncbi:MAG TPA: proton-conducting transporter membrane subunit [Gaiellaceae bacterium]|jgi:multicomponent Na+:H+ antiporter subunit D|nr:proton-conducting transporter membrane subunit [Gaiellaceae bacterium]
MLSLALAAPWFVAVALVFLDGRRRSVGALAVAGVAVNVGALVAVAASVASDGPYEVVTGDWPAGVGITLRADALGTLFATLSSAVVLAALAYEVLSGVRARLFPALALFLTTGLTGIFLTGDVFNFFVFFELSMISAYVLSVYGGERRQIGGAFIFAVVNLLGSFLFLIAVGAIYHVTGSLDMAAIARRFGEVEPASAILIAVTFFVAFGVKLGLFPFHFWLPPLYTGARPAVAAMLAGALANIGSYGLIRFGAGLLPNELGFGAPVLLALGAASVLYGSIQALSRRAVAEVLAYSSIGQAGYILIALAVGGPAGYTAAVVYAVVNSVNKALLFLTIGVRGWLVGAAFVVGAFSVTGIPPSAGFFGKVALFQAAVAEQSVALGVLVFVGGALSFVYMFQIYQQDYWSGRDRAGVPRPAPRAVALAVAAVVLGLGVWPEPLLALTAAAAEVLAPGAAP